MKLRIWRRNAKACYFPGARFTRAQRDWELGALLSGAIPNILAADDKVSEDDVAEDERAAEAERA